MGTSAVFDFVAGFGRVVASSVSPDTKAVLLQVAGIGALDPDEPDDSDQGEVSDGSEAFGALGVVSRPLPPETVNGRAVHHEVAFLRTSDGLVPIASRDLRLDAAFPAGVKEGQTGLAGYGGGLFTLDLTAANSGSKKASIAVAYVPYEFDANGTPAKAHSIILDPTDGSESISIAHGDGYAITLSSEGILMRANSSSWAKLGPDLFFVNAKNIQLQGNVAVGRDVTLAVPLTPPSTSTSFFIAP